MYDEPDIDPELALEAQEWKRQHVLTGGEVAHILGVSQQAVNLWTHAGTIAHLAEKGEDRKIAKNRYSLEGVVTAAMAQARKVRVWAIPLRLLTQYDATPLKMLPPELLEVNPPEEGQKPAEATEWTAEAEAARILKMSRGTLRNHRLAGYLNPKLRIRENPSPAVSGVQYSALDLQSIALGKLELYSVTNPPARKTKEA